MNLDHYFNKIYDEDLYNCLHFAAEIWLELTNVNLIISITNIMNNGLNKHIMHKFEKLNCPQSPCIVLMQRANCRPHVGIYIDGSILHLTENGPQCFKLDVVTRGFKKIRFVR